MKMRINYEHKNNSYANDERTKVNQNENNFDNKVNYETEKMICVMKLT